MGYTSLRDMVDGGGAGQSGDTFKGPGAIDNIANAVGIKPLGSGGGSTSSPSNDRDSSDSRGRDMMDRQSSDRGDNERLNSGGSAVKTVTPTAPAVPQKTPTQTIGDLVKGAYKGGTDPTKVFDDPNSFINGDMKLANKVPDMDKNAAGTTLDRSKYALDTDRLSVTAQTATAETIQQVKEKLAATYDADKAAGKVATEGQSTAAQGKVSDEAIMKAEQIDIQGAATGTNKDGSTNEFGKALNTWATQDISRLIDTSTVAGKLLAQELGDGNYTDTKATVQGQMEILSKQFVDADGNPKIPSWAAATARNVSKIAAFKGMTGTAATAAMSQAIMEASLPMAQQDAQFFQTATMANLSNKQQSTIQKASVLANLELANLDARTQAAVQNSQAFLQMDMQNLANEQQSEIVNTQSRVQALLEDSRAENAARLFGAQSANDFTKFYDQLNTQIAQYNTTQVNGMRQFNTDQVNSTRQFNASLENSRELFYKDMQFNVDMANAKWRQTVVTTETSMKFEAARQDVQNLFGLSTEAMSRMWDREDAILNYTWQSTEGAADRDLERYLGERKADSADKAQKSADQQALGAGLFEVGKFLFTGGLF